MTRFTTISVRPTGERQSHALIAGAVQVVTLPIYPESGGTALREARVRAGVGLRDAARRLGVSAATLSGVEAGSLRFADPADYERARLRIVGETQPREPGCQCHWEVGDSPCPVHGEDEE